MNDDLSVWQPWLAELADGMQVADARRLFHGRGADGERGPGWINVDWFAPDLLLVLYAEPPQGFRDLLSLWFAGQLTGGSLWVQHRQRRPLAIEHWVGDGVLAGRAQRNGCSFELDFSRQNVGFFTDIEPVRQRVEALAYERCVINLFSFTCVFSVVALRAGARRVVNVDMSRNALAIGRNNHLRNGLAMDSTEFHRLDVLRSWGRIGRRGPYDLAIIDPPSFQKGSFIAERDYVKVLRRLDACLVSGARILACLNAPELPEDFLGRCRALADLAWREMGPLPLPNGVALQAVEFAKL